MIDPESLFTHGSLVSSLTLEFLLLRVQYHVHERNRLLKYWHQISTVLEAWAQDGRPLGPFPPELLEALHFELHRNGPHSMQMQQAIRNSLAELLKRIQLPMHDVQMLTLQLIRPWEGSLDSFRGLVEDIERKYAKQLKPPDPSAGIPYWPTCPKDHSPPSLLDLENEWSLRLVWPGRNRDASWKHHKYSVNKIIRAVDSYWRHFVNLIEAFESIWAIQPIIMDQIKRHLYWHFVLVPKDRPGLCVPLPVFPAIFSNHGRGVIYLGEGNGALNLSEQFKRQVERAFFWGIDAWISRNRSWKSNSVTGGAKVQDLWNATLILDFREVVRVWKEISPEQPLEITDQSAGLTVGVGTIGLLAGHIPDASVWLTGPLQAAVFDKFGRNRILLTKQAEPLVNDGIVSWGTERAGLDEILKAKLHTARLHGIAKRVVIPDDSPTEVFGESSKPLQLGGTHRDLRSISQVPQVHSVCISRLSNAADVSLPVTYRKYRYVNAPDLRAAFSFQYGKEDPQSGDSRGLLTQLAESPVSCLVAPAWAGKSYAITQALIHARFELMKELRTGPRVTFIRIPYGAKAAWEQGAWRLIMNHLSFPREMSDRFLWAGSFEKMAEVFVVGFRSHGPDILVLSGLDRFYDLQNPTQGSRPSHIPKILATIASLLCGDPVKRKPTIANVVGSCELILERRSLQGNGSIPHVTFEATGWNPTSAWRATLDWLLRNHQQRVVVRRLLGAISVFSGEFYMNGLEVVSSHLGVEKDELRYLLEGDYRTIGLKYLHLVRMPSDIYVLVPFNQLYNYKNVAKKDSGPLLSEAQGRYHVNPLIRDLAFEDFKTRELQDNSLRKNMTAPVFVASLHVQVTTNYLAPFLSEEPARGLLPLEALLPDSLMAAEQQLHSAFSLMRNSSNGSSNDRLLKTIQVAQMKLLRYYRETSVGKADWLFRKMKSATGPYTSRRAWLAYLTIEEFLRNHPGPHHPNWWILRGKIIEKLSISEVEISISEEARRKWKSDGAEQSYLRAVKCAQNAFASERPYILISSRSELIRFLCKHQGRLRVELPEGFRRMEELIETFTDMLSLSCSHGAIPADAYCAVGEVLWERDHKTEACEIWKKGLGDLKARGGNPFGQLTLRALGSVILLQGAKEARNLICAAEWLPQRRLIQNSRTAHNSVDKWTSMFLPLIDTVFSSRDNLHA